MLQKHMRTTIAMHVTCIHNDKDEEVCWGMSAVNRLYFPNIYTYMRQAVMSKEKEAVFWVRNSSTMAEPFVEYLQVPTKEMNRTMRSTRLVV